MSKKVIAAFLTVIILMTIPGFSQSLDDNWNDFLHYTKIGRLDLAKGYANAVLEASPDPVKLLDLSQENPQGYSILLRVKDTAEDKELVELTGKILDIIEQGKFIRRADPKVIIDEIKRLNSTDRGRLTAVKRLQNAGEYAITYMVEAMEDAEGEKGLSNIIWALPQIGRDSLRPLVAALQTSNLSVKAEIIKALGQIGYPQALAYLKYIEEKDSSEELRTFAQQSINEIDPAAAKVPSAQLFYRLAENYYYHAASLAPAEDANFANVWFWDTENKRLLPKKVDKRYFYELMAMRSCEWSLKADPTFARAIGLWIGSFFKAESAGIDMPEYFGSQHAPASVYATTVGPEYLHQALARAVKDNNAYVALGTVEALGAIAGEKSLFYRFGPAQPLVQALSFDNKAVRYSAAIAIAEAGPKQNFAEVGYVTRNLAEALAENGNGSDSPEQLWTENSADSYATRAVDVMLKIAQTQNPVIDLSPATDALVQATKDDRDWIKKKAADVLAYLNSPNAQQAIATMALDENNKLDIRISAFGSLATSAKFNANLLDADTIDAIYSLVSSTDIDPKLRSEAATAYGALNLPSEKIKDLILMQASS